MIEYFYLFRGEIAATIACLFFVKSAVLKALEQDCYG